MAGRPPAAAVETTTRTVNAYGRVFGRPFEVCASTPFSLPLNPSTPIGKRAASAAVSISASVPLNGVVCTVLPLHQLDAAFWKSPGAVSVVSPLLGSAPGANWTTHVYGARALTYPPIGICGWPGSSCWNQSGEVISASGGMSPAAAAATALYAFSRP